MPGRPRTPWPRSSASRPAMVARPTTCSRIWPAWAPLSPGRGRPGGRRRPNGRSILADCQAHGIDTSRLRPPGRGAHELHRRDDDAGHRPADVLPPARRQRPAGPGKHFDFTAGARPACFISATCCCSTASTPPVPEAGRARPTCLQRARAAGLRTSLDCVSENSDRFAAVAAPVLPHEVDLFLRQRIRGRAPGRAEPEVRATA